MQRFNETFMLFVYKFYLFKPNAKLHLYRIIYYYYTYYMDVPYLYTQIIIVE